MRPLYTRLGPILGCLFHSVTPFCNTARTVRLTRSIVRIWPCFVHSILRIGACRRRTDSLVIWHRCSDHLRRDGSFGYCDDLLERGGGSGWCEYGRDLLQPSSRLRCRDGDHAIGRISNAFSTYRHGSDLYRNMADNEARCRANLRTGRQTGTKTSCPGEYDQA